MTFAQHARYRKGMPRWEPERARRVSIHLIDQRICPRPIAQEVRK
jgi:hypothetical protein